MSKYVNVRGESKGQALKRLQAENDRLRAESEALKQRKDAPGAAGAEAVPTSKNPEFKARRFAHGHLNRMAYGLFEFYDGPQLEDAIQNTSRKIAAFKSQIDAEHGGTVAWGPTITPYEDRMNQSLMARLIKQRRELLDHCRAIVLQEIEDGLFDPDGKDVEVPAVKGPAFRPPAASQEINLKIPEQEQEQFTTWYLDRDHADKPARADQLLRELNLYADGKHMGSADLRQLAQKIYSRLCVPPKQPATQAV